MNFCSRGVAFNDMNLKFSKQLTRKHGCGLIRIMVNLHVFVFSVTHDSYFSFEENQLECILILLPFIFYPEDIRAGTTSVLRRGQRQDGHEHRIHHRATRQRNSPPTKQAPGEYLGARSHAGTIQ